MNLDDAKRIRADQLAGKPVKALELQRAVILLAESGPPRPGRRHKLHLPPLTPFARMKVNATLLFRLGLEIGRAEASRATWSKAA